MRIGKFREAFKKVYTPNWSSEIFIKEIKLTNPTTYLLQAENGEEIKGAFYELQKVKHPEVHFVEKVLRKKRK